MVAHQLSWKPIPEPEKLISIDTAFGWSKKPVRNESELVVRAVDFANGKTDTRYMQMRCRVALEERPEVVAWLYETFPPEDELHEFVDLSAELRKRVPESEVLAKIEQERDDARRVLLAAASDLDSLIEWINTWRVRHGTAIGMIRRPVLEDDERLGIKITWQLEQEDWLGDAGKHAVLAYVALLLLTDHDRCRSDLGYCRLLGCGKFFMVERGKPGKPRRDYCSDKHMKQAHAMNATARSRLSRAKKKAEAAKPRRRRTT